MARGINRRDETILDHIVPEARRDAELAAALQRTFLLPRVEQLTGILERAVAHGEIAELGDPLRTLCMVTGPLMHGANVQGQPLDAAYVEEAITLRGAGSRRPLSEAAASAS